MRIEISLTDADVAALEFRLEQTSDRQQQPLSMTDRQRWSGALDHWNWQYHRWDMFFVEALVPFAYWDHNLGTYQRFDHKMTHSAVTHLMVARFFVHPEFQNPWVAVFGDQPTTLTEESRAWVLEAAKKWFAIQPEYRQMTEWGLSAMRSMREVLVLMDKFDAEWWAVFEDNVRKEGR